MRLPPAHQVSHTWIQGGVRTLHECAFAAAELGHRVELRGWVDRATYDDLAATTPARPDLPPIPRPPSAEDVVFLPAGHEDPIAYLPTWLSEAQLVVMALSPIGMLGWPFAAGWHKQSPLTIAAAETNRSESFAAMAAMGVAVWTNARPTGTAARAGGASVAFIGEGSPIGFPAADRTKPVDVVWLAANRWSSLAEPLAERLSCSVRRIDAVSHPGMLKRLGEAKVLLYPGRLEGEPRITREARAMGTVPVVVRDANPVSVRMDESHGVLPVPRTEAMPEAIESLLADRERLRALAARAQRTARAEAEWPPFVARIAEAVKSLPEPDSFRGARCAMGSRLREEFASLIPTLHDTRQRAAELEAELGRVRKRKDHLEEELILLRERQAQLEGERADLRSTPLVRLSTAASGLGRHRRPGG